MLGTPSGLPSAGRRNVGLPAPAAAGTDERGLAMQDIEQGRSEGTVPTMIRIYGMLGLKLGVARAVRR